MIPTSDVIIDFHEGWGYMIQRKGSRLGSSITYLNIPFKQKYKLINKLNLTVTDEKKKWVINDIKLEVANSLREFPEFRKKIFTCRTTGQQNVYLYMLELNKVILLRAEAFS